MLMLSPSLALAQEPANDLELRLERCAVLGDASAREGDNINIASSGRMESLKIVNRRRRRPIERILLARSHVARLEIQRMRHT